MDDVLIQLFNMNFFIVSFVIYDEFHCVDSRRTYVGIPQAQALSFQTIFIPGYFCRIQAIPILLFLFIYFQPNLKPNAKSKTYNPTTDLYHLY
jgi:hypothetical protein